MLPNRKIMLKTAVSTHIIKRGFSTDQRTPRMLRRYLSLKSFETREVSMNQLRCNLLFAGEGDSIELSRCMPVIDTLLLVEDSTISKSKGHEPDGGHASD